MQPNARGKTAAKLTSALEGRPGGDNERILLPAIFASALLGDIIQRLQSAAAP
jgi:hypothetical protein